MAGAEDLAATLADEDAESSSSTTKRIRSSVSFDNIRTLTPDEDELEAAAFFDQASTSSHCVLYEGWVFKHSRWLGRWRKRWACLTPSHLQFFCTEQGYTYGEQPTEELEVPSISSCRLLDTHFEIAATVGRATPLSCVVANEMPEESHVVVHVRTKSSRDLYLDAGPLHQASVLERKMVGGELASVILNASLAARTNRSEYLLPKQVFVFEEPRLVSLRDRYSIGREIGRGRYGAVFSGRCLQTGRAVAIKKVRLVGAGTTMGRNPVREAVHEEVAILREVRSRHVVALLDYLEEGVGTGCLVMELLPGGDLYTQVAQRYWPPADGTEAATPYGYAEGDVREILLLALSGLTAIHDLKVVHRDLKPENVLLLDRPGELLDLRIADFGHARRLGTNQSLTAKVGTRGYMAPEVIASMPYGLSADMWSLGVILYTLLSGRLPFPQCDDEQLEEVAIREGRWSFAHPNWDEVSLEAKDTVRRLLRQSAHTRPTAHEALVDLPWLRGDDVDTHAAARHCVRGSIPRPASLPGSASLLELQALDRGSRGWSKKTSSSVHGEPSMHSIGASTKREPAVKHSVSTPIEHKVPTTPSTADLAVSSANASPDTSLGGRDETPPPVLGRVVVSGGKLSAQHMRAGTDEHGVRVKIFTATVTCGRAVRAGLDRFSYTGDTIEVGSITRDARSRNAVSHHTKMDREKLDRLGLVRHGEGLIRYDSGNVYVGHWEHDRRAGHGRFEYACGDVYVGEWKDGRYHGHGKYTGKRNGGHDEYEGQWLADKPHGYGRYVYSASGDVYVGGWVSGLREGDGKVICADGSVYEGVYECGERVRVALSRESFLAGVDERGMRIRMFTATLTCERATKADLAQSTYEGDTVPSAQPDLPLPGRVRQGRGRSSQGCGNVYDGEWHEDKPDGHGTYTYACGDTYTGEWKQGKYHGKGHYVGSDRGGGGDEYDGEWREDAPHGHGRYRYSVSGDVYEGQFSEGQFHGKGMYWSDDGNTKHGEWQEGLYIPTWQRGLREGE